MEQPKLGTRPDETSGRDAIHIAIAPVVAGEKLWGGTPVRVDDGIATTNGDPFGIVDPFLTGPIQKGERFYLCLYPGSVTSLRHVWTHPAFAPKEVSRG